MKPSRAQILFAFGMLIVMTMSILAGPTVAQNYRINLIDVDGNALSTADGHVTIVVLTSKANIDKARLVGDRTPDFCLANPLYRMITVLAFETKPGGPVRAVLKSLMRHRLDAEARRLQIRYDQLKLTREARRDVFGVADFENAVATQFDLKPDATLFHVFVFGRGGDLRKQWDDVPQPEDLVEALKQN